jgi:outer membrane PBP1 activator LpoA protein
MMAARNPRQRNVRASWGACCRFVAATAALVLVPALSLAQTAPASTSWEAPELPAIVLVLPLESATLGRAADAVKAGFAAAAEASRLRYAVIPHADDDVLGAFARARDGGARVIVGPLARDDIKAIAAAGAPLPWTIALNQPDEATKLPDQVYTLTLSVDADARQIARRMRADGAQSVAVISDDSTLHKRMAGAFADEWILQGGGPPATYRLGRTQDMLVLLRRELARAPVDAVLLALDGADAALVRPYAGQAPTYASSLVNDRQPPAALRDLDGVRFVDIAWLTEPDAPAFAKLPHPEYPNNSLDRLYALGIDAFRVAQAFVDGPPDKLEFDGATGRVVLEAGRQLERQGRYVQFHAGNIVSADGR